jgi:FAD/FMN-containing dehydrogenase
VEAVAAWRRRLAGLEAAELFLQPGLALVCDAFGLAPPFPEPSPVYVLVEVVDDRDLTAEVGTVIDGTAGVRDIAVAQDAARAAALWAYREEHTAAINTIGPPHKLDVTLPLGHLAEFVERVPAVVDEAAPRAATWLFGHVGDGNVHVNITGASDDEVDGAVLELVAALGGSISAEHGIGTAKRPWLHLNRTPSELAAFRAIKGALDPVGILNPNVLLP